MCKELPGVTFPRIRKIKGIPLKMHSNRALIKLLACLVIVTIVYLVLKIFLDRTALPKGYYYTGKHDPTEHYNFFKKQMLIKNFFSLHHLSMDQFRDLDTNDMVAVEKAIYQLSAQQLNKLHYFFWREVPSFMAVGSEDAISFLKNKNSSSSELIDLSFSSNPRCKMNSYHWDLRIIALVYDRPDSLRKLLSSLNAAHYFNASVRLEVWIDRSKENIVSSTVLLEAMKFQFRFGDYCVKIHLEHVGIFGQWLNTWDVFKEQEDITVILEDDLTVSPFFYKWLKLVHGKYDRFAQVSGYSLQGYTIKHSTGEGRVIPPSDTIAYLYPVIGTWGFSPRRGSWKDFITWFHTAFRHVEFHPIVPVIICSDWYQSFVEQGKADHMWSIWHIYYSWMNSKFTLYPRLLQNKEPKGLSANRMPRGLHYDGSNEQQDVTSELLTSWKQEYENLPDKLPFIHYNGDIIQNLSLT